MLPISFQDREATQAGDVSSRVSLRKNLKCKNFEWYKNNVYPEMDLPKDSKYVGRVSKMEHKKYSTKKSTSLGTLIVSFTDTKC